MKQNLYEISAGYIELANQIEELEGELTPELEAALEINKENLEKKALGYHEIIGAKKSLNGRVDEEIKRLQAIKTRNNKVIDRLNTNLLNAVILFGDFEINTLKFGTRKSQTLEVNDASLIPNKFKVQVITEKVEKNEIKKALKLGEEIEGVTLHENQNLSIK